MSRTRSLVALVIPVAALLSAVWLFPSHRKVHAAGSDYTVLGWSEYGMQTIDSSYSIFALAPPHTVIHAQVIDSSGKLVKSGDGITVTYEAAADEQGAINSTSAGKTDFWLYAASLMGFQGAEDEGTAGAKMPGVENTPQPMTFDADFNRFSARGIPITPKADETLATNYYPIMRLVARDADGTELASTRISLPVSSEAGCKACHQSGVDTLAIPDQGWVNDPDPERDFRLNILRKHDELNQKRAAYPAALAAAGYSAAGLYETASNGAPVLCVKCHSSNAPSLPSPGLEDIPSLTTAMHNRHAGQVDPSTGVVLDDQNTRATCYRCHAGPDSKSLRGAMGHAVAADGSMAMECQSCHGNLTALGDPDRKGWLSLPNCQACHTGTAVTALPGSLRATSVFGADGQMVKPKDATFATTPDRPEKDFSLYRASSGHGGLQCEACHGPTHAESPSTQDNDNLQSAALQGVAGPVQDCVACHKKGISSVDQGPHGMHEVGTSWVTGHQIPAGDRTRCSPCHGTDFRGTPLSRVFTNRTIIVGRAGPLVMFRGYQVSCYTCHNGPTGSGGSPLVATVGDTKAAVIAGESVTIQVPVANNGVLRIVSQPRHGTAFLKDGALVYQSAASFAGTDRVTYAALNQGKDSNLGVASIEVDAPPQ